MRNELLDVRPASSGLDWECFEPPWKPLGATRREGFRGSFVKGNLRTAPLPGECDEGPARLALRNSSENCDGRDAYRMKDGARNKICDPEPLDFQQVALRIQPPFGAKE